MLRELDQHLAGQVEQLAAGADQRLGKLRALLHRTATPYIASQHDARAGLARGAVPKAAFGELAESHAHPPRIGLHDARVDLAHAARKAPLHLGGIRAGDVELKVWHRPSS